MKHKLAYLGPSGTFCEQAARRWAAKGSWELVPYGSIDQVMAAVQSQSADRGVVPIENSCEGSVNQTLDLLAYEYDLQICAEIVLPVQHNLLARAGVRAEEITRVLSHPQAFAQCRKYLAAHFPHQEYVDVSSTAEAARRVAESREPWAAIGTSNAAAEYGLEVRAECIQDRKHNETRFVVLGRESSPLLHPAKTSLVLYLLNQPGALYKALEQFYRHNINLTKIESRPAQTRIGDYLFFIDIDGHQQDPSVREALAGLKSITRELKILGSYAPAESIAYIE